MRQSTLTLLVTGVNTDHAHNTLALDDLAVAAKPLDRCEYFHDDLFTFLLLLKTLR
jgi:hypothetical protein